MSHDPRYRLWVNVQCYNRACANFKSRYRLRKKPHLYVQEWRAQCPGCHRRLTVDHYRESGKEGRRFRCNCGGRPWQHRRGSPGCLRSRMYAAGFRYDDIGTERYEEWRRGGRQILAPPVEPPTYACADDPF